MNIVKNRTEINVMIEELKQYDNIEYLYLHNKFGFVNLTDELRKIHFSLKQVL